MGPHRSSKTPRGPLPQVPTGPAPGVSVEAANRRCEQCGGAVPDRMSRQRNERGQLVCEECKRMNLPSWNAGVAHSSLDVMMQSEMRHREAQALVSISKVRRMQREGHDSGDGALINHCFAGETEYLTPDGVKSLEETAGTTQKVLTSPQGEKAPRWVDAEIKDFGVQPLLAVTLKRNKMTKVIHATAGHRWLVGRVGQYRIVTTENLQPEHRLASLLTPGVGDLKPDDAGVRHGVIFGDGTVARKRWARVTLWGDKDKELLPYFPDTNQRPVTTPSGISGVSVTGGFTAEMKTVPSLDESDEYLYGWLAGYFAADGNVTEQGQAVLDSASVDNLLAVRDVATHLGISVYSISTRWRQGYGDEPREVSRMQFVSSTLNENFFLIEKHRDRFKFGATRERVGWTVVSVEETGRIEHVYCAVVPETESFVLVDNIWTMNCPFCGSGAVSARSDGSTECDFCNSVFTVQVQPQHPYQPQTVNGVPTPPPGMPNGSPMEMSGTDDPAVAESEDGVAANPLDDEGQQPPSNGPVAPGQPPTKQPHAPAKADPATNPGKGEDGKDTSRKPDDDKDGDGKKKSLPPWLKKKTMRTATGQELDAEAYMAHLALSHADDREAVLDMVRVANTQRQAMPPFEAAGGRNEDLDRLARGVDCPRCQAYADEPCKTRRNGTETEPHQERIDRAVRLHQKNRMATVAGGLTRHQVKASEVQEGDYLDSSGKVRVHKTLTRNGYTTLAWRLRGSKAPGTHQHPEDHTLYVWRRS